MWFCSQEVVSTSNSNTAVALCRLFEMLIVEPLTAHPEDKSIRIWIMVLSLYYVNLFFNLQLYKNKARSFWFKSVK